MTAQIGRFGYDADARPPSAASQDGENLDVSGFVTGDTIDEVESLVNQAFGLANTDERWVPATFSHNPRLNGMYAIEGVDVTADSRIAPPQNRWYKVDFSLRRFPVGFATPAGESALIGAHRSNSHSVASASVTPSHWIPNTAEMWRWTPKLGTSSNGGPFLRSSSDGLLRGYTLRSGSLPSYDGSGWWYAPLADWYDGTPRAYDAAGYLTVGSQALLSTGSFRFENGLTAIASSSQSLFKLSCWGAGGTWGDDTNLEFGYWSGGAAFGAGAWTTLSDVIDAPRIVRTTPSTLVARLVLADGNTGTVTLSVRLRRGDRWVYCQLESTNTRQWGWQINTSSSDSTGIVHQITATNRWAVATPVPYRHNSDTPSTVLTSTSTNSVLWGFAHNVSGSTANEPDRVADLKNQFYASQFETVGPGAL